MCSRKWPKGRTRNPPPVKVEPLSIPDVALITPARFADSRGHFSETFSGPRMASAGLPATFPQDNQSFSAARFTLRGLHCQVAPYVQGKLVRVLRGAIWDVAIDARRGSASYGRYAAATLDPESGAQLWVPPGFLHGFLTLEPDTEVFYKVTAVYDRASERGVRWDDPALALPWPLEPGAAPLLSEKDSVLPAWAEASSWFP